MADEVDGPRFVEEPLDQLPVRRVVRMKQLDGDLRSNGRVLSEIDRAHPSPAEEPDQAVSADSAADQLGVVGAGALPRAIETLLRDASHGHSLEQDGGDVPDAGQSLRDRKAATSMP